MQMRTLFTGAALLFAATACPAHAGFLHGMHIGNDTNVAGAVPVLRDLNVTAVRLWADADWNATTYSEHPAFQKARDLKAAGFHVTLLLQDRDVPTYDQAKAYFQWAAGRPGMRDAVDHWEILNEIPISTYWAGTPSQYVNRVLKPAYEVFQPLGETVVGASITRFSGGLNYALALRNAGYLQYSDIANVHPYTSSVSDMKSFITSLKGSDYYGSKPLTSTEWNFKSEFFDDTAEDRQRWADMIAEVYPFIEENLEAAHHYRLIGITTEGGWPGVIGYDYRPVQPFYDTWQGLGAVPEPASIAFLAASTALLLSSRRFR